MNNFLKIGLIIVSIMSMVVTGYAKTDTIKLENKQIILDVQEKNGRKLYPLRAICNELGIDITKVTGQNVVLQQGENMVSIGRDSQIVFNNNGYFVSDVVPVELNGTIYVPIRVISYMFGYNIDLSNGITLTKIQNFNMPKPTYGSTLLTNDIRLVLEMGEIVEADYYWARLKELVQVYDYAMLDMCEDYTIEDQLKIDAVAQYLKSHSGRVIYEEYSKLLDYFYKAFYYLKHFSYEAFNENIGNINKSLSSLNNKLNIFLKEVYKNGTSIQ
ncbi:MAG: copper amine oxidase N-terminal domain-containing protein [Cellulosilyticaceae bacterium]